MNRKYKSLLIKEDLVASRVKSHSTLFGHKPIDKVELQGKQILLRDQDKIDFWGILSFNTREN